MCVRSFSFTGTARDLPPSGMDLSFPGKGNWFKNVQKGHFDGFFADPPSGGSRPKTSPSLRNNQSTPRGVVLCLSNCMIPTNYKKIFSEICKCKKPNLNNTTDLIIIKPTS